MDELLSIVGQVYDAALDPTLWPKVLAETRAYLGVARTVIAHEDAAQPVNSVFYHSDPDPEWEARYIERYMLINPMRLATVTRVGAGDIILTRDFMSPDEYAATPFAREWLAARDLADISVAIIEKTATQITVLSVLRGTRHGFADEEVRRKLGLIAPHIHRSVAVGRLLERRGVEADTLIETLDQLNGAVFLMTRTGVVVHANAHASTLPRSARIAQTPDRKLSFEDRAAETAVLQALELAANGDAALGTEGRSIPMLAGEKRYVATVMPLTSGRRIRLGSPHQAVAAVCIREADFRMPAEASAALAPLYDLTRRELAVLMAAVEIGGVPEVASVLGLTEATVKTHLRSVFRKTGVSRQADLVKLVSGVASPFRKPGTV